MTSFFRRVAGEESEPAEAEVPPQTSNALTRLARKAVFNPLDVVRNEMPPDATVFERIRFRAMRFTYEKMSDLASKAWDHTKYEASDVLARVPEATADRFDPRHTLTAMLNHEGRRRYVDQQIDRVQNYVRMYRDPVGHFSKNWDAWRHPIGRWASIAGRLENRQGRGRTKHAAAVIEDQVKDRIAGAIGSTGLMMAILNTPRNRAKTRATMDYLFPKSRLYGRRMQKFVPKLMLAKPLSRMVAHRRLLAGLAAYKLAGHIGSNIEANAELAEREPSFYQSLVSSRREMISADFYRSIFESFHRVKEKERDLGKANAPDILSRTSLTSASEGQQGRFW